MSAWMVALPLNWDWDATPSPFYARLICLMQQQLTMAGCQCRAYPHIARGVERAHQINDYLNLSKDVEAGLVNAVLTAGSLDPSDHRTLLQRGIPVCFCGSWDLASCGSVIDSDRFARDACHLLWDQGIRHVGLVASRKHSGNQSVFDGAHAAASTLAGLRLDELDRKIEGGTSHINHFVAIGRETADHLLSLPLDLRPQALIITDDHIAQGLAHVLSIESDYVPKLVVQTHRAAPMIFNLPVIRYEVDDAQLARTAVDMTIQRLLNPDLMDEVQWHIPQLVQSAVVHQ
jgi:DNA-binding LacI/PurR family transcriptional regulator